MPQATTQPQPSAAPSGLDPQIVNLAKAIRQTESQGNFQAQGKSGEYGAYQFLPSTWNATAPKYGVNVPLQQATPQQQNEVAYKQLADWKTQNPTWNVGNFASAWNAGPGKPDAYLQNNVGTNAEGVAYDTPTYAKNVATAYQQFKAQGDTTVAGPNQSPTPTPPPSVGGFLGNVVQSGANFIGNTANALIHPIQTVQNLGSIAAGGFQELGGQQTANTQNFDAVKNYFGQRYGSVDNLLHTAYTDPVGLAADVSAAFGVAGGVAGAVGKVGELSTTADAARAADLAGQTGLRTMAGDTASGNALTRTANAVQGAAGAVSNFANPLNPIIAGAGKLIGKSGLVTSEIGSQLTGFEPQTIDAIVAHPDEFTPEQIANTSRAAIAHQVETGLQDRISSLEETGAGYQSFRAGSAPITVPRGWLDEQIRNTFGLDVTDGEITANSTSAIRKSSDVSKIQDFYNLYKPSFQQGAISPTEFLNLRDDLAKIAYNDLGMKDNKLSNLTSLFRGKLNDAFRKQVPGLESTDQSFSSQAEELKTLRKGILDKNGNLLQTAVNRIANAGGKGKDAQLAQLETIVPGISKKLQVLKAIEDIQNAGGTKVGTYPSAFLKAGGIIAGAASGNMAVLATALATTIIASPGIAVPLLRLFGNDKGLVSGVLAHLTKFATLGAVTSAATNGSGVQSQPSTPDPTTPAPQTDNTAPQSQPTPQQ